MHHLQDETIRRKLLKALRKGITKHPPAASDEEEDEEYDPFTTEPSTTSLPAASDEEEDEEYNPFTTEPSTSALRAASDEEEDEDPFTTEPSEIVSSAQPSKTKSKPRIPKAEKTASRVSRHKKNLKRATPIKREPSVEPSPAIAVPSKPAVTPPWRREPEPPWRATRNAQKSIMKELKALNPPAEVQTSPEEAAQPSKARSQEISKILQSIRKQQDADKALAALQLSREPAKQMPLSTEQLQRTNDVLEKLLRLRAAVPGAKTKTASLTSDK